MSIQGHGHLEEGGQEPWRGLSPARGLPRPWKMGSKTGCPFWAFVIQVLKDGLRGPNQNWAPCRGLPALLH